MRTFTAHLPSQELAEKEVAFISSGRLALAGVIRGEEAAEFSVQMRVLIGASEAGGRLTSPGGFGSGLESGLHAKITKVARASSGICRIGF